jgi:hypothetical protein
MYGMWRAVWRMIEASWPSSEIRTTQTTCPTSVVRALLRSKGSSTQNVLDLTWTGSAVMVNKINACR